MRVSTYMLYQSGERNIVDRSRELLATQSQLASGKRIDSPADDPLGAADATSVRASLAQFEQFKDNQGHARYLLNLGESALARFIDAVQDVQEKLVAAGNGAYGDDERRMIAQDLEGVLGRMVGLANSSDGAGGYLFAGARENAAPFAQTGNAVAFRGDEILQRLEISRDRFQQVKFSGDALFMKMRPGNGTFTTAAAATNTGSASIDAGTVQNPTLLTGLPYTIDFSVAGGTTTYRVVRQDGSPSPPVVASGTYTSPTSIEFDGIRVSITGAPADGDRFDVAPSGFRSVFDTLAQAIEVLRQPAGDAAARARFNTALAGAQASIGQALDHLLLKRAAIGSALAELDAYERLNDDRTQQYQGRLSLVEDLDYAKAVSELARRQATFDAAIRSYSSISRLSLFDFL
ncbi:MAG: flagellar hook-associated protein FlgL [Burkholderiaceae bacterium]